jgi:hypothetical protein
MKFLDQLRNKRLLYSFYHPHFIYPFKSVTLYLGKSETFTQNYATRNPDGINNYPQFDPYDTSFITKLNYTSWTVAPSLHAFNLVGIYYLNVTLVIEYYGDYIY